jgi:colanic acid biosynthesis glycosyl transferase WcaI
LISPPGDASALAKGIVALDADAGLRARLGAQARTYAVAHLSKQVVMEGFERALMDASAVRDPEAATAR